MKKKTVGTTQTSAKAKSKTKLTLGEFRAWLSGVEEMQEEGWIPNAVQWVRIRNKIDDIVEGRSFNSDATGASYEREQPVREYRTAGPSFAATTPVMPLTAPPPFMNTSTADGARITTPTIDTSNGSYASSLE